MSPLILFPLLVATAMAAPAGLHAATNPLVHGPLSYAAPGHVAYAAAPAQVAYAAAPAPVAYAAAPAVTYTQHVQVPLTKTIHYENRPVVTGYQTTILKPSIAGFAAPALPAPVAVAPAPVAVEAPAQVAVEAPAAVVAEEAPAVVQEPAPAPAPVEEAAPVQADAADTEVIENPEFRSAAAPAEAAAPAVATVAAAPALTYVASPGAYATYTAVAAPQPVLLKSEAPHFDQLVTKEKVLAPVRTHTQITPQLTQVQPEVTVRRVITEVPVAQPVAYTHTQYVQQPAFAYAAAPAAYKVHHHL